MIEPSDRPGQRRLQTVRLLAGLSLAWEMVWPLLLPSLCVLALFVSLSWLGIWPHVADPLRLAGLAAFGVAALGALLPLRRFRLPRANEIDNRIELKSRLAHRPVTAQKDRPATVLGSDDPFAKALWAEHQSRMRLQLENLKAGIPTPSVAGKDPWALRTLIGLLLFVGLAAGWGDWSNRLGDAFRSHQSKTLANTSRIDAWVTPPAYTNRPPIFLDQSMAEVTVPEGSELFVRTLGVDQPALSLITPTGEQAVAMEKPDQPGDGEAESKGTPAVAAAKKPGTSYRTKLTDNTSARLTSAQADLAGWSFKVIPDNDPAIQFVEEPKSSIRGALEFAFSVADDYGVIAARAEIRAENNAGTNSDTGATPLVDAPKIDLPLPRRRATEGTSKTSQDLTAHPWAGAEVTMTLVAEDEAGQTGRSETRSFTLPQRVFTKPLALAVVEERRNLAMDANAAPQVAQMLDIITTTHPDVFIPDLATYTALRMAYHSISRNKDPDELRATLDLMWQTALAIEDGDLSRAEQRLRDAQERLSKALEDGASDQEIDELMKELRTAMDEFLRELTEQMAKNQQNQQAMPMDPNVQALRQQDLERMMQQIEDLAKSGSKDAARQLLQELQRMMNNLQTARPGQQQQQQQTDEFSKQMNKLGDMMRQQQQLMDQTFDMQRRQQQQGQNQNQNQQGQQDQQNQDGGQKPMTPEEFAEAMKELQRQQGELQRQMQEMQNAMREQGMNPGEKLGEAGEAMGEAEGELGQGQPGEATGQQGRALQAMREGAQQMMQQMQNQAGEQGRRGERGQHGQQTREDQDPLGRQSRSQGPQLGNDTKVPGEIDAQRARRILDAIRRKLGETSRPRLELDYLDRLIPSR